MALILLLVVRLMGGSFSTCATVTSHKATILENNILKNQHPQTQQIHQLCECQLLSSAILCPNISTFLFDYIHIQWSPGFLGDYCTSYNSDVLPKVFFFFCTSSLRKLIPPHARSMRHTAYQWPFWQSSHWYFSLLLVFTCVKLWSLGCPYCSSGTPSRYLISIKRCHTASGTPFCSWERHS